VRTLQTLYIGLPVFLIDQQASFQVEEKGLIGTFLMIIIMVINTIKHVFVKTTEKRSCIFITKL